jgi:hypothetical protein
MKLILVAAVCGLATGVACADDAEVSYGGSPSALKGTGTVSMQSEVVVLDIGPNSVQADCQFVFKNNGPACTIRMGFPDGDSAYDENRDNLKAPAESVFSSFSSFVDGKSAPTTLVRGKDFTWHAKNVSFPANGIRRVRERYTVPIGGDVGGTYPLATAYYVLHTGASWRGPIGRMEIIARFRRSKRAHPTRGNTFQDVVPLSLRAIGDDGLYHKQWSRPDQEVVVYDGPGTAQAQHNVIRWTRTNIRPTQKDDVYLAFKTK